MARRAGGSIAGKDKIGSGTKKRREHNRDKVNFGFAVIVTAEFAWNTPKTDRCAVKTGVLKANLQNLLQY
ncbi:MAG: hypothetical protein ACOX7N_09375 [Lawsonibacter sp.]